MADNLTSADLAELGRLAGNTFEEGVSNRDAYYSYLEGKGYDYGALAGGVVRHDTPQGRLANAFLAQSAVDMGVSINLNTSLRISYDC